MRIGNDACGMTRTSRTDDVTRVRPNLRDAVAGIAIFVALVGTALRDGGFFPGSWTAVTVAFLWLVAVALLLGVRPELTTAEVAWLGLLATIVVWTALSI